MAWVATGEYGIFEPLLGWWEMQEIWIGIIVNIFGRNIFIMVGEDGLLLMFSRVRDDISMERTRIADGQS